MGDNEAYYGDSKKAFTDHYVNLSSAQRDKRTYPTSNDCEVQFDGVSNAIDLEIVNFEIPHTRYAIDEQNNTFYISEKIDEGVYNFFGLKAGTGGYTIGNLAVSLELSARCPIAFTEDTVLLNTYNFVTSSSFGKIGIISSGDYPYNIHVCQQTLDILKFTKKSDTAATIQFVSPYEYILAPGALLTLNLYNLPDRQIQVVSSEGPRTVSVIGDFSGFEEVTTSNSKMVPFSSQACCAQVAGFGEIDLTYERNDTKFKILALQSPFSTESTEGYTTPMILTDFPVFLSTNDYVKISGTTSFLEGTPLQVTKTHDDTHFEVGVDVSKFYESDNTDVTVNGYIVDAVDIVSSNTNTVTLTVESAASVSVGDTVEFNGFTSSQEWSDVEAQVTAVDVPNMSFEATFTYPTSHSFIDGSTYLTPISSTTGYETTYISPGRFDLSRGRRIILCKAVVENLEIGTIQIPNSRDKFFGRIQLFSGADLINFLSAQHAVGKHRFNSVLKRFNRIRLRFYNEDGSDYDFVGVDYSMFVRVKCLNSNTGL